MANDAEFFILLTPSGSPDTGAVPGVQITNSGSLRDQATGLKKVVRDAASVTPVDKASPVLVSASSSEPVSGGNLLTGTQLTLSFSEAINANSTPAGMTASHFKVQPDGVTAVGDLAGASATVALGAANQLVVTITGSTTSNNWTAAGEIDLDTFTDVKDNAASPNAAVENGVLSEVLLGGLSGAGISARETVDADADGQIGILLTGSEAVNDNFTGLTVSGCQAYNPRIGAYGQTRQGSNVYGSWGSTQVQRGDQWASTSRYTNRATGTTTRTTRTDSGGAAVTRRGPGSDAAAVRTRSGDVYAGRDGNVYLNEGGSWQKYDNGSWGSVDNPATRSTGTAASTWDAGTRDQLNRDYGARAEGAQRTSDYGSYQRSGSSSGSSYRSSGSSYRGGGGSRGGRGGGGRRR